MCELSPNHMHRTVSNRRKCSTKVGHFEVVYLQANIMQLRTCVMFLVLRCVGLIKKDREMFYPNADYIEFAETTLLIFLRWYRFVWSWFSKAAIINHNKWEIQIRHSKHRYYIGTISWSRIIGTSCNWVDFRIKPIKIILLWHLLTIHMRKIHTLIP